MHFDHAKVHTTGAWRAQHKRLPSLFNAAVIDVDEEGAWVTPPGNESDFDVNKIVEGKILRIETENVLVDIGFKSEGLISLDEWVSLFGVRQRAGRDRA